MSFISATEQEHCVWLKAFTYIFRKPSWVNQDIGSSYCPGISLERIEKGDKKEA